MISVYAADRWLNALVGNAVTAATASTVKAKLHTADPPLAANELSGNGYSDATVDISKFTQADVSTSRELRFPEVQFFASATAQAQTARSVALWHGTNLVWSRGVNVVPNESRVYAPAGQLKLSILKQSADFLYSTPVMTSALTALAGGSSASRSNLAWHLHSAVPNSGNALTGGGVTNSPARNWTFTTIGTERIISHQSITFPSSGTFTGATNALPKYLGLWSGNPSSGTLLMWRTISPSGTIENGTRLVFPAGDIQIKINMASA